MGAAGPSRGAVIVQTGQGLCNLQVGSHCPEPVCVFGGCSWASCEVLGLIALGCQRPAAPACLRLFQHFSSLIVSSLFDPKSMYRWAKVASRNRAQFLSARHSLFTPRGGHEDTASHRLVCSLMVGSGGG